MYQVYVLLSLKNSHLYIGYTNNLKRRLHQHQCGRVKSTRSYLPYKLIYSEMYDSRKKATIREKELKTSSGRRFLKQFIK